MSATLIWPWCSLGSLCQMEKMAASLNSLFFVFKMSSLPKYRVMYYDYIVKWCSWKKFNWCVSLDIAKMLALNEHANTANTQII